MAENPYARFKPQSAATENPYAQFKKTEQKAAPEKMDMFPKFGWGEGEADPRKRYLSDSPIVVNLGAGMHRTLKGLTRLALPKSLEPDWVSDEARMIDQENRKTLEGTPGSTLAQMAGETLPTLPVGLPARGVQAVATAASRAPRALQATAKVLGQRVAPAAVEGAVDAAATADVGTESSAAGLGAAAGGAFSMLGKTGRALNEGLIKKSDAALDLENLAAQHGERIFQPLAQVASEKDLLSRLGKSFYREVVPVIPGTGGRLERQGQQVGQKVREIAAREAAPTGMTVPKDVGENMGAYVRDLKKEFATRYDNTVKSYAFNVPNDFRNQVAAKIKAAMPNVDDVTLNRIATEADQYMARFSSGQNVIDGENLLNVKRAINKSWGKAQGPEKPAVQAAESVIDELIETELKFGNSPQNLKDLKDYQDLSEPYRNFTVLRKAAGAAKPKKGNFSPSQLARSAKEGSVLLDLAQTATEAGQGSVTGRTPRWLGYGGAGALAAMDPVSGLTALGAGQVLSTEFVQKALMGDLGSQRAIIEFLRQNPGLAEDLGRATRNTATTQIGAVQE